MVRNNDVPGVIGRVGTVLGEAGLNIANFALGRRHAAEDAKRRTQGMQAVAVVQVDGAEQASQQALTHALLQLRAVEAITSARVVELGAL